jgi:hypothetical protein
MWIVRILGVLVSLALLAITFLDGFETILQPRRVTRRLRLARLFYRMSWWMCRHLAVRLGPGKRREGLLAAFGPLSLLALFGSWMILLILAFGLLLWSLNIKLSGPDKSLTLATYFYFSGTNFFTLGLGDFTPASGFGRFMAVAEAGLGFGFIASIISYLPALSQAYSRREVMIGLLDARAGSPPTAEQLLFRLHAPENLPIAERFLIEWEPWAGELLESHLSFPVLAYFRSQHENQSWLAALACILDTSAILIATLDRRHSYQAQLTFAVARHAAVDLGLVVGAVPSVSCPDRLPSPEIERLRQTLTALGLCKGDPEAVETKLAELRRMYEPFLFALSDRFLLNVPNVVWAEVIADNWQRSAFMQRTPGIGNLQAPTGDVAHFS